MKRPATNCTVVASLALGLCASAHAGDSDQNPYAALTIGEIGIADDLSEPVRIGASWRFRPLTRWKIAPAIGAAFAEGGARFVYVDARRDFRVGNDWVLAPSFGIGSFDDGNEVRLGSELEFRSGLELAREFDNGFRVGLAIYHLSNGGIAERNPGTESLVLSLLLPYGE